MTDKAAAAHSHLETARRIEGVNANALLRVTDACARLFPEAGAATLRLAGGVATFVGAQVPTSYAVGFGMHGPVTEGDIARVVEFYVSRGAVPRVDACPLADESLFAALRHHRFQLHWFTHILARPLDDGAEIPAPAAADGVTVRVARPDEDEVWTRVVDAGFDAGPMTEPRHRLGMTSFHSEGTTCYFAEVNGQPVAGAALHVQNGYAALMAASVVPEFRGRGIHAALIRTRLQRAHEIGCDLAGLFAAPGSQSQRNAERHGFRLAYSKATMKTDIPA